ncbi:hypothetical protein Fmac_025449 [Flemingia macrophylla]|uniref:Uncharacterized protein n=1 Tax=Flemingia macrophylla TaxID=520843 RepID=A0ABD1LSE5_9FABA
MKPSSRTRKLHRASRDIGSYKETRWTAESSKAEAESELSNAKKMVKDLSSMIDESSNKAKTQMRYIERLEQWGKGQQGAVVVVKMNENYEYAQVMTDLEYLKNELFKLKLDVASVMKDKSRVEIEIEASNSMMLTCLATAEVLKKEIKEANEEQVLDAIEEIDESKEPEMKLAVTVSYVNLMQNELKIVKEMEKRVQGDWSVKQLEGSFNKGEELEDSVMLQTITEEFVAANKELALVEEERRESGLKSSKSSFQNFLIPKTKLEAGSTVEEKARSIVKSLSHTLEKLKTKTKETKQENKLISREVAATKEDIQKIDFDMNLTEKRLQDVMQKLEAARASEAHALDKLKTLT